MSDPAQAFFLGAPAVVSNRNHFASLENLVDDWLFRFDTRTWEEAWIKQFRTALLAFADAVVSETKWAFKTGIERALDQTQALLRDPEYYRVTKRRRNVDRQTALKHQREQEQERERQAFKPATPAEINRKKLHLIAMRDYNREQAEEYEKQLAALEADPLQYFNLARSKPAGPAQ